MEKQAPEKQEKRNEVVVDATSATLGRLASFAAKQSLLGNEVIVVNSEKAVVSGNTKDIYDFYIAKRQRGQRNWKGPMFPSKPAAIIKKTVKGMLSHKKGRGNDAWRRIKCYDGIPAGYSEKQKVSMNTKHLKSITLAELSARIGRVI